jgi:bifunctional ADP-heptose synthase (sugar kinase/adenylyltransferase)
MTVEFFKTYEFKLKSREELANLIGPYPRESKIILCHGVFDVVHPGHVRHLAYAKTKADILVASITADRHITKGTYRPHIPEKLRALNLAAFEMVDYVIIDENTKPLENLKFLKPTYFAKGFEYSSSGLPAATQEEADIVEAYGGEMIFTPGDVVYSSSKFIEESAPDVQLEKLLSIMYAHNIDFQSLRSALDTMSGCAVHVVGDTIVDSYTRTNLIGGQTKTPTFSVLYQGQDDYIGGAGIVAQHLSAAGADVTFSTVLGNDVLGNFVIDGLNKAGIHCNTIIDETRPTTNKNAIIAGGYRLLKIDTLDNRSISDAILEELTGKISSTQSDAVVFADFRHGIFNQHTVLPLTNSIPENIFRVADSQVASRWGNITEFKNFDLITPNEREARFALGDQDSTVGALAGSLVKATSCGLLLLKLGDRGVFISKNAKNSDVGVENYFSIDSFAKNIVDAVGAGDALLAYATLAMMVTQSEVTAGILGSMAAACECEFDGNIPIKPSDVLARIDQVENTINYGN